jgi:hypothetical protein
MSYLSFRRTSSVGNPSYCVGPCLEYSPTAHMWSEPWSLAWWYWDLWSFQQLGPSRRSLGHWGHGLSGMWESSPSWLPSSFSPSLPGEQFSAQVASTMRCCLSTGPKQWGQASTARNLQNCELKQAFLFIS